MFLIDLDLDLYAPGGAQFLKDAVGFFEIKKADKLLEVGSSGGFNSRFLAKKYGCSVTATDINPAWVPVILEKAKKEKLEKLIKAQAEDILDLTPRKNTYHIVLANAVVFLADKTGSLQQINRVLKNGGHLILGEPIWLKEEPPLNLKMTLNVSGAEVLTVDRYRKLLSENGFEIIGEKIYQFSFWDTYHAPLLSKINSWKNEHSPLLTKYVSEIDAILEETEKIRQFGEGNLGYSLFIAKKIGPAVIKL